jgi:FkbM family methyltransferase
MELVRKVANRIQWFVNLHIRHEPLTVNFDRWIRDQERQPLYSYPLGPSSIVLDVGAFRGDWSSEIMRRYDPFIFAFEPIAEHVEGMRARFGNVGKVTLFPFGIADADSQSAMIRSGEASSSFLEKQNLKKSDQVTVEMRDVARVFAELGLEEVDLMKVNIEGDEYKLLPRLIETQLISKVRDLLVQFHHWIPNSQTQRDGIQESLRRTHVKLFDYPFTWELWRRKTAIL